MLTYHSLTIVDTSSRLYHVRLVLDRLANCLSLYRDTWIVVTANNIYSVSATHTLLPWMLYDDLLIRCVLTDYILMKNIISPWRTDTSSSLIVNLGTLKVAVANLSFADDYSVTYPREMQLASMLHKFCVNIM